jgi:cytidylate kinase
MVPVEAMTDVVALDGPAGSGKTTVARHVAEALGWRFVDTGATYRAVTLAVLRAGVDLHDTAAVAEVAARAQVVLGTGPQEPAVQLDGEDVSAEIRGAAVTAAVSAVSAVPAVRATLVDLQRRTIGSGPAVVEGRDIATVVAPQAAVKVYLDARPEVRARRRAGDTQPGVAAVRPTDNAGAASTDAQDRLEGQVLHALTHRDALDSKTNALRPSNGAVHLDTSDLTLDEVVAVIVGWVRAAGLGPQA